MTEQAGYSLEVDDPTLLEDPEVVELLAKANASLDENPLYRYFPHARQRLFHENRLKTKIFIGGNRSGKSTATVVDCLIQALDRDAVPEHLLPYRIWDHGFKCRYVTPDYGRAFQSVLETIQLWCPQSQLRGGDWEHAFKDKDKVVYFANGNFIEFLTLEQDPDSRFGGSARHRVVFDEEPTGDSGKRIREQCAMRLADHRGDELFGFTPVSGELGWTFDEFWEKTAEDDRSEQLDDRAWVNREEGILLIQASMDENPHLDAEGREEALAKIPVERRAALQHGNFAHAKGLVYEEFDLDLHVVDEANVEPEFIAELEQLDCIDPGQVETAILFAGLDKRNRLIIYDELVLSGKSAVPEWAAERMATLREGWGLSDRAKYTLIDPAAKSRDLASGERVGEAWVRAGVPVIYAKNDVEAGVLEVKRRMNHVVVAENDDGEKEIRPDPLVLISSRCKNLIRQKRKYRQKPKEDGSFGVVKVDDHGPDCERYLCLERPVPIKRKRARKRDEVWTPGTAPPFKPDQRRTGTVMGKFT